MNGAVLCKTFTFMIMVRVSPGIFTNHSVLHVHTCIPFMYTIVIKLQ